MIKHYNDYYWKEGRPYGKGCTDLPSYFKVIADPYYKHVAVEEYTKNQFHRLIYDSRLLNFRHLTPSHQTAWEKTANTESSSWIRNEHDHLLYREQYHFKEGLCIKSELFSVHGILLATHHLSYRILKDDYDGILLVDANDKPIMLKKYAFDEKIMEFTELLSTVSSFEEKGALAKALTA